MKTNNLFFVVLFLTGIYSGEIKAESYLLLKFSELNSALVPKWIGITKSVPSPRSSVSAWSVGKGQHLQIDESLVLIPLSPKQYYLLHFDFAENYGDDDDSIHLTKPKKIRIKKNTIHYLGDIRFEDNAADFTIDFETIHQACVKYGDKLSEKSIVIHMQDGRLDKYNNDCNLP